MLKPSDLPDRHESLPERRVRAAQQSWPAVLPSVQSVAAQVEAQVDGRQPAPAAAIELLNDIGRPILQRVVVAAALARPAA